MGGNSIPKLNEKLKFRTQVFFSRTATVYTLNNNTFIGSERRVDLKKKHLMLSTAYYIW